MENKTAKIIHFPEEGREYASVRSYLLDVALKLELEDCDNVLIAAKNKNGEVITGYYKANFGLRQELCGHIQCDIIDQMIRANIDRYVDFIE